MMTLYGYIMLIPGYFPSRRMVVAANAAQARKLVKDKTARVESRFKLDSARVIDCVWW